MVNREDLICETKNMCIILNNLKNKTFLLIEIVDFNKYTKPKTHRKKKAMIK